MFGNYIQRYALERRSLRYKGAEMNRFSLIFTTLITIFTANTNARTTDALECYSKVAAMLVANASADQVLGEFVRNGVITKEQVLLNTPYWHNQDASGDSLNIVYFYGAVGEILETYQVDRFGDLGGGRYLENRANHISVSALKKAWSKRLFPSVCRGHLTRMSGFLGLGQAKVY